MMAYDASRITGDMIDCLMPERFLFLVRTYAFSKILRKNLLKIYKNSLRFDGIDA